MITDPRQLAQEALALDTAAQDAHPSTPVGALAQLERLGRLYDMCQPLATALLAALDERDAYRKAKQENDERFMLERDEARRERDELRLTLAAEQGRAEGASSYAGMDWMDDVKVWRSALLRLVGGRTDHLAAMFGEEIARAAVAWGNGDSARWDNLSAPEQAHWVADHIERAAMLAADAATVKP